MSLAQSFVHIPCTEQMNVLPVTAILTFIKVTCHVLQCLKNESRPAIQIVKKNHLLMRRDSTINKLLFEKIDKSA
jgi:hypothetical protein